MKKDNKPAAARRPRPKATAKGIGSPAPQWGRPDRPAASSDGGAGRPSPICFRRGKRGHLSSNCTNAPPLPKRNKATDSASVVFDMTPWADEFAVWRSEHAHAADVAGTAPGMLAGADAADDDEDADALAETKG